MTTRLVRGLLLPAAMGAGPPSQPSFGEPAAAPQQVDVFSGGFIQDDWDAAGGARRYRRVRLALLVPKRINSKIRRPPVLSHARRLNRRPQRRP